MGFRPGRNLALAGSLSLTVAASSLLIGAAVLPRQQATDIPDVDRQLGHVLGTPASSAPSASTPSGGAPSTRPASRSPIPSTRAGPVPPDLQPPLVKASRDLPAIYADGCVASELARASGTCVYGVPASHTTVVLFGDSHAAQWFPALDRLASEVTAAM